MKSLFLALALVSVPALSFAVSDQEVRDMMVKTYRAQHNLK